MKKDKILSGLRAFLVFMLWVMVFDIVVRLFEALLLSYYQGETTLHLLNNMKGVCYDAMFLLRVSLPFMAIYIVLHYVSPRLAKWAFALVGSLTLLVSHGLVMYFVSALIPLDKVIFSYSIKEIVYIAGSTGSFVWWSYVFLIAVPIAFAFCVICLPMPYHKVLTYLYLVLVVATLIAPWPPTWLYDGQKKNHEIANKQEYLFRSVLTNKKIAGDCEASIKSFQSMFPDVDFQDENYPLTHLDKSPDVLSDFFDLDTAQMPNIVVIITEGLSREFSGYNSELPSATPFLDSLSEHSLTWLNCMSSSQRTIAVLPTIFGCLPFGEHGFMVSSNCPRFYSLPAILKQNGYTTSFFYGGWLAFDNMLYFVKDMGVTNFLPDYKQYPENIRNTWGLYDEYLFSESLENIDFDSDKPRLDIYLTLSTHDPFDYPDKERYTQLYTAKLRDNKVNIPKNQHEQYASYLYYDDCLRQFFDKYKDKNGFDNTIFIITGDHCFNMSSEELTKYHVPLVVWSPMLKHPKHFAAMASHRDITPSLIAMLKKKYGITSPEIVSWVNKGLDTTSTFAARTFTPQLKESRMLENMVYNNYFYDCGEVYELVYEDEVLKIQPTHNEAVSELISNYLIIDNYVMSKNALIPQQKRIMTNLQSIDTLTATDFISSMTKLTPLDTLGRTNVFALNDIYPFNMSKIEYQGDVDTYTYNCDFDIYIPDNEDCGMFKVCVNIKGKSSIKDYCINDYFFKDYGKWAHVSIAWTIDVSNTDIQPGEVLQMHMVNSKKKEFYISNFNIELNAALNK